jgi:flavin reductase (DIM6/NTAB) family NADH-FMN oxidoreductase RutF
VKTLIEPKMLYFGTPVVLISSLNADGSTNLAPMSSAWWLGNTAMLGMSMHSQTVANLTERPTVVLNLVDPMLTGAVDRLALLTGRPDVPEYKQARGYSFAADKFQAAGLTPVPSRPGVDDGDGDGTAMPRPAAVAESLIHLEGEVRRISEIDQPGSGLRALEVAVTGTWVDEDLMMADHPSYIDAQRWDPLIMKFTQYFGGGSVVQPSSLARGWNVPQEPRPAGRR